MTLKYGPNLGQLIGAAAGDEHYQAILSQWRALDGLVQPAVSSRISTLPTTDMLEGDRYLVTSGTYANRIARYREANSESGLGAGWEYFTPREGWYVWSVADKRGYRYSNGAWGAMAPADVGLGNVDNTSDASKPISNATQSALDAKVNISVLEAAGLANATPNYSKVSCDGAPVGATIRYEGAQSDATLLNYPTSSATASAQVAFSVFTYGIPGSVARLVQIASEIFGSPGANTSGRGRAFIRVKHDTNWYDWREVALSGSSPSFAGGTFSGTVTFSGGVRIDTRDNANIELGYVGGAASTPYIDFHSGATATDYDFRMIAWGGNGSPGGGTMTFMGAESSFDHQVRFLRPIRIGQYTLSTLPSASAFNGYEIDVTDAAGGPKRCRSNGSSWHILNTTTPVS